VGSWDEPSFSNGSAVYGDLDNVGDLDLVVKQRWNMPLLVVYIALRVYNAASRRYRFLKVTLSETANTPFRCRGQG
jgi:hypothetical protein